MYKLRTDYQKDAPSVDPPKLEDRVSVVEDALIFLALGGM